MKISVLSKLRSRASKFKTYASRFYRKLKTDFLSKDAVLVEAPRPFSNNYAYDSSDPWISEGPSVEAQIAEAIGTPIGSLAEIFSADLPPELWTLVFGYLSQHDRCSCLKVSRKWYGIADNNLLWKDLDLLNACIRLSYSLEFDNLPETLLSRIDNARSITVVPKLGTDFTRYRGAFDLGDDVAFFLRTRKTMPLLPNLRVLTLHYLDWTRCLQNYLPNLTELDVSRVDFGIYDLCGVMKHLRPSVKRLKVDGLKLCPGFFAVVVSFSKLEYLSLSKCSISSDALKWFMRGTPIPRRAAGCSASTQLFKDRAGAVMSSLKDLDLTDQTKLDIEDLHAFHEVRLNRLPANSASGNAHPARMRPHPIHIDLRGCRLRSPPLARLLQFYPGTRTTPHVNPHLSLHNLQFLLGIGRGIGASL